MNAGSADTQPVTANEIERARSADTQPITANGILLQKSYM